MGTDANEGRDQDGTAGDTTMLGGWKLSGFDYPTFRLSLVAKVMDRLTLRHLAERSDFTYAEWRVLSRLATTPNGATVGQLADMAWVDRAEVSRAAAALEARGLTTRAENPADRRKPILTLTPAGRAAFEPLARERGAFHARLVTDLTEEERATLDRLLGKVARRLTTILRSGDPLPGETASDD